MLPRRAIRFSFRDPSRKFFLFAILALLLPALSVGQSLPFADSSSSSPSSSVPVDFPHFQQQEPQNSGSITGLVQDSSGTPISNVHVTLTFGQDTRANSTDSDGRYFFSEVPAGPFHLTFTFTGFAPQTSPGNLASGEVLRLAPVTLTIATAVTEVRVLPPTPEEIAEQVFKEEIQQRALGFIPNFYVAYTPEAPPLTPKQKFELAFRSTIDPVTFGVTAAYAGMQQATDQLKGYGSGPEGYAKRFAANYVYLSSSLYIGGAILPSLLKQDPRYFYKGTGTKKSRLLYALANSVICKGDNGRWQPNYSSVMGSIAAGGLSNLYYPETDRGTGLVFKNTLLGIGASAATNILQEFVIRKFTPNLPPTASSVSP